MVSTIRSMTIAVKPKIDTLLLAAWTVVICVLLISAMGSFVSAPGRDSSAFIYVAKGVLEGEVPYLDRWDHKGPLVYLLNVIGLALLDMWGVWLVEMAFLLGSVWLIYAVVKDRFGPAATLFPIAVFSGYFVIFAQGGNYTEQYALLFQFLTLYLFTRVEKGNRGGGYYKLFLVSIGALAAATFLLRPNLVGMWLAIGIYWIFVRRDDAPRRLMWSGVGAAAALLPVIWIFAIFGGLYHFWDAVFIYNFTYSDAPLLERIKAVWHIGGSRLTLILLPIIASWSIGLYYFRSAEVAGRERFEGELYGRLDIASNRYRHFPQSGHQVFLRSITLDLVAVTT